MSGPKVPIVVEGETPRCSCGHERSHFMVSPEPRYTGLDWFWVLFGITTVPREIRFRCRRCKQVFDQTEDPRVMKQFV